MLIFINNAPQIWIFKYIFVSLQSEIGNDIVNPLHRVKRNEQRWGATPRDSPVKNTYIQV